MREIKFRAFCKIDKKIYKVLTIYLECREVVLIDRSDYDFECSFADIELMQYTGLKDSKGKEIYEGDILKWVDKNSLCLEPEDIDTLPDIFEVVFKDGSFIATGIAKWGAPKKENFVVVGNIYENPELLKA